MIVTNRIITVRKGVSSIDNPVIVYRGDYEVSIKFTIMESKFRFKSGVNLVDSEKASHGQLAILTPYGGNVFSEIVKCEDGTVTFTLTKEMIDQLEEVGLYSFQIRLFDYYRESRVSIPPVEFGIEVREPVASEDHDNEVNNAIVGYSIAKVVDPSKENVGDTFDANGNYNKTDWETGDRITEGKLNKIEDALDKINEKERNDVAALDRRVSSNYNVLESNKADKTEVNRKIWGMANMGQDVRNAMTGGSVAVVGENAVLEDNIVNRQVTNRKLANNSVDGRTVMDESLDAKYTFVKTRFIRSSEYVNYMLITIDNIIGALNVGDTVRICGDMLGKDVGNVGARILLSDVGIGSTQSDNGEDYNLDSVYNFNKLTVYNNTNGLHEAGFREKINITNPIPDTEPYLVLALGIKQTLPCEIELIFSGLYIQINDSTPIDITSNIIKYVGMFQDERRQQTLEAYFGDPIKTPEKSNTAKVDRALLYDFDNYVQFSYDVRSDNTTSTNFWVLLTVPNVLGQLTPSDIINIEYRCIDLNGNPSIDRIAPGIGSTNFADDRDYNLVTVDNFCAFSGNPITHATITKNTTTMHIASTGNVSADTPYLLLGFRVNQSARTNVSYAVGDIKISKNDGSLIEVQPVYAGPHREKYLYSRCDCTIGKGVGALLTNKLGVDNTAIKDGAITFNKLNATAILTDYKWHAEGTCKGNDFTGGWVLVTIPKNTIVFDNDFFTLKYKITLYNRTLLNLDFKCIGHSDHMDATDFYSIIPGYALISNHGSYDATTGIVTYNVPRAIIENQGDSNIVLGVRMYNQDVLDKVTTTFDFSYDVENITDSPNKVGFASPYFGYNITNFSSTKTMIDNDLILTNRNYQDIIDLSGLDSVSPLKGKYISILGDSISTYTGWIPEGNAVWYNGKTSDVTNVKQTWWHQAITELQANLCVNNSWSGSRVTTTSGEAPAGCMTRCQSLHTDDHDPDIIIVYLGVNDYNGGVDIGTYDGMDTVPTTTTTFREAYAVMLDKILTRYQTSRVFVCTLPYCDRNTDENAFPEKNQDSLALPKYNEAIRELADAFGVDIIELSKCGITFHNRKKYLTDELHPLQTGMDLITRKVVNTLKNS